MKTNMNAYLFFILCIQSSVLVLDERYNWLYILSKQVRNLEPHHVTFFISDANESYTGEQNYAIQHLSKDIPCKTVDLKRLVLDESNNSLTISALSDPRRVTFNFIFDQINHQERAHSIIDIIAQFSSDRMRQQCVIIAFGENPTTEDNVDSVLKYAWE